MRSEKDRSFAQATFFSQIKRRLQTKTPTLLSIQPLLAFFTNRTSYTLILIMKLSTTLFAAAAALSTTVVSAGDFTQDVIFYANMPNMDDPKSLLTASDQTLKTQSTVATCMKKAYALVQPGKKHGTELHDTEILTSGPVEDLKAPEGHALSKRGRRHLADVNAKEEELGATWSYGSWPYVDTLAAHLLGISTGFWAKTTGACYLCDYSCKSNKQWWLDCDSMRNDCSIELLLLLPSSFFLPCSDVLVLLTCCLFSLFPSPTG